ncbi:IS5 family transposase [Hydrogenimonas sp.]
MELTDKQWRLIEPLFPEKELNPKGKGRPPRHPREVLNGVLWILKTGAQWSELPYRYPPYQTFHRRFQKWVKMGLLEKILQTLAQDLKERGDIDVRECFIDGSFVSAKKGVLAFGKTKRGKGTFGLGIADASGLPVALCTGSASPHEVKYVEPTLEKMFVAQKPEKLIGDKAYDSDKLNKKLEEKHDVEMIAPHRANRAKPQTQDGRKLRRYKKRWKVERLFAWLQNFRRIQTRWEYHLANFHGFV